jgi:hypothetical protein
LLRIDGKDCASEYSALRTFIDSSWVFTDDSISALLALESDHIIYACAIYQALALAGNQNSMWNLGLLWNGSSNFRDLMIASGAYDAALELGGDFEDLSDKSSFAAWYQMWKHRENMTRVYDSYRTIQRLESNASGIALWTTWLFAIRNVFYRGMTAEFRKWIIGGVNEMWNAYRDFVICGVVILVLGELVWVRTWMTFWEEPLYLNI